MPRSNGLLSTIHHTFLPWTHLRLSMCLILSTWATSEALNPSMSSRRRVSTEIAHPLVNITDPFHSASILRSTAAYPPASGIILGISARACSVWIPRRAALKLAPHGYIARAHFLHHAKFALNPTSVPLPAGVLITS
ncbi:hypothetical protein H4582DRAFT_1893682 [Lactarius indigo]|nr:hypothetical protein H4582DRAFT_1893682 [Lactarius indigo]